MPPTEVGGRVRKYGRLREVEVRRGRSRRMRRPVGERSIASRRRGMKYGVEVASANAAMRSEKRGGRCVVSLTQSAEVCRGKGETIPPR